MHFEMGRMRKVLDPLLSISNPQRRCTSLEGETPYKHLLNTYYVPDTINLFWKMSGKVFF